MLKYRNIEIHYRKINYTQFYKIVYQGKNGGVTTIKFSKNV